MTNSFAFLSTIIVTKIPPEALIVPSSWTKAVKFFVPPFQGIVKVYESLFILVKTIPLLRELGLSLQFQVPEISIVFEQLVKKNVNNKIKLPLTKMFFFKNVLS